MIEGYNLYLGGLVHPIYVTCRSTFHGPGTLFTAIHSGSLLVCSIEHAKLISSIIDYNSPAIFWFH